MEASRRYLTAALAACILGICPPALAHRMLADALAKDDGTVVIDAFFADGKPVVDAAVEIIGPSGSLFATGRTDVEGRYRFRPDGEEGRWRAVITGTMGHRAEAEFTFGSGHEPASGPGPPIERVAPVPWLGIVSGLGFIFGLSSFVMVLRLRARLRKKEDAPSGNR